MSDYYTNINNKYNAATDIIEDKEVNYVLIGTIYIHKKICKHI